MMSPFDLLDDLLFIIIKMAYGFGIHLTEAKPLQLPAQKNISKVRLYITFRIH